MQAKVNLRGMINLDQVEDLLSEVLTRMDIQESNMKKVTETVSSLMPRQAAERCIDELHEAVKILSGRVDAVREASLARVDNELIPAGELSARNKSKLDRVISSLSDVTQQAQVLEADMTTSLQQHSNALVALREDSTPIAMSRALQAGLKECGGRVDLCEVATTKKLDKSALGHIESLVVDLEKYDTHRKTAISRIDRLEGETTQLGEGLAQQSSLLQQNTCRDEEFCRQTTEETSRLEAELQSVRRLLQTHERSLEHDCVRTSAFRELLQWSDNASSLMNEFERKSKLTASQLDDLSARVHTKAEKENVAKLYMRRDQHYEMAAAMGKDIDTRAKTSSLQGTQSSLASLQDTVSKQQTQVQIALRFVEWFTQRGDTYECNMQVIDKHLKQLATSSVGGIPGTARGSRLASGSEPFSAQTSQTYTSNDKVRYFSIHPTPTEPDFDDREGK